MAIEPAMQRVAREIGSGSVALAEELTLTVAELSYLQDRRKAFENLGKRTGLPTVKSVVTSLIQSERYGTPLGTALRVLAQENRDSPHAGSGTEGRSASSKTDRANDPVLLAGYLRHHSGTIRNPGHEAAIREYSRTKTKGANDFRAFFVESVFGCLALCVA